MDLIIAYAMAFVSKPYVIGDKNPALGGLDCSGYVCEILKFAGVLRYDEILSAAALFDRLAPMSTHGVRAAGAISFYGSSLINGGIEHVGFMVNPNAMLHAAGGDRTTTTVELADKRPRAFVRGDLVDYRKDLLLTLKPSYAKFGLI